MSQCKYLDVSLKLVTIMFFNFCLLFFPDFSREVAHPLASETLINADEIPPDPPKRFLSRVPAEKDKSDKEGGQDVKKKDRSRSRSRGRDHDRDRRDRDRRDDRDRGWRRDRDRDRFAPRYGRSNNASAHGRKIKGRGRVVSHEDTEARLLSYWGQ